MHKPKRKKLALPSRWLHCPRMGDVIHDLFVPFKTPLDNNYNEEILPAYRFSLENVLSSRKSEKIGLIVNLTNTERFYNSENIHTKQFTRIPCEGHDGPPTENQVMKFVENCSNFFNKNRDLFIGVHCTHGFNRTGFMIVCYLFEKCEIEINIAVELFSKARPPGIYKQNYLDELSYRYDYDGDKLIAPSMPDWDEEKKDDSEIMDIIPDVEDLDDDDDNVSSFRANVFKPNKKTRKDYVVPKIAAFMDGVNGVSVVDDTLVMEEAQQKIRDLMYSTKYDFIGSQPVSMTMKNIHLLIQRKYMMSWKADGTRYLMLIVGENLVYMFDRDNCVYKVHRIYFPKNNCEHYYNTIVDGEMVIDEYNNQKFPRYLIYDIMVVDEEYVGDYDFPNRLQMIKSKIIEPRSKYLSPEIKASESFGIRMKDFWSIDKTYDIWDGKFHEQLTHKMDGLIFQPADEAYVFGKCISILKWKPPELNSIDFRLRCEYLKEKDAIPKYVGYLYVSGERKPFGTIENIAKHLRESYNNKIVECTFDRRTLQWQILRERTDKSMPNHITTAISVMESINIPVDIKDVYEAIKQAKIS